MELDGGERHWLSSSIESLAKRLISLHYCRFVGKGWLVILRSGHLGFRKLSFSSLWLSITHRCSEGLTLLSEADQRGKFMQKPELWGSWFTGLRLVERSHIGFRRLGDTVCYDWQEENIYLEAVYVYFHCLDCVWVYVYRMRPPSSTSDLLAFVVEACATQ